MIPSTAFLLSVAGIGISLTGFSGLVSAFRRGSTWQRMDSYRLRQIPEMGLATTLIALATLALADTTGNPKATIQILSGVALIFSILHMLALSGRLRGIAAQQSMPRWIAVGLIDLCVVGAGARALGLGTAAPYEWLLVVMLARPMLAFVLVLADVAEA